ASAPELQHVRLETRRALDRAALDRGVAECLSAHRSPRAASPSTALRASLVETARSHTGPSSAGSAALRCGGSAPAGRDRSCPPPAASSRQLSESDRESTFRKTPSRPRSTSRRGARRESIAPARALPE